MSWENDGATTNRRGFITAATAAAGALAVPTRVFAQASYASPRDRKILEIAQREVARAGDVLWRRDIAGIADFGLHSSLPRMHFANLEEGTVTSYLVAHGTGSDPEHDGMLNWFSNEVNSNATARGAYVSWEWYKGKYGTSIRLGGLDPDNTNTFERAIVMHAAEYAKPEHVAKWGRLGRSNGCFAMAPGDFMWALTRLSGGRLVYADKLDLY
ncbi:twin-arginine translocation signal domain-containing protein [Altererythrobacter salegens]|uniref:Twin-arginine translocation signal domain-containing protein n=1 Tax=Croceibacterium salegens TaxID=1737568 RepID=A0A6I4SV31_9SPHN|nr:murein L,D-transpeptidase catalytic domain family protein [Croceibacterium salegens]MXO60024.1 twin-arginine translocation signal domain-containing protein [Croceibacterium salegens]